jgi:hypothetical protein
MNMNIHTESPDRSTSVLMIDMGDFGKMIGYTFKIIDYVGRVVYETLIRQQFLDFDLDWFGRKGIYFLEVIDNSSQILEIQKIVVR